MYDVEAVAALVTSRETVTRLFRTTREKVEKFLSRPAKPISFSADLEPSVILRRVEIKENRELLSERVRSLMECLGAPGGLRRQPVVDGLLRQREFRAYVTLWLRGVDELVATVESESEEGAGALHAQHLVRLGLTFLEPLFYGVTVWSLEELPGLCLHPDQVAAQVAQQIEREKHRRAVTIALLQPLCIAMAKASEALGHAELAACSASEYENDRPEGVKGERRFPKLPPFELDYLANGSLHCRWLLASIFQDF